MLPFLKPHRRNVALAFGGALVGSAIAAATPAVERQIVDNVILHHRSPLLPWLILLVAAGVVRFGAAYVRRYTGGRVSFDVQYDLRNTIYDQLQRLDFARHDEMQTGQLVSRANSDVGLVQGLLAFLPLMTGNVLLLMASVVIMAIYSPLLTVVALIVVPLIGLVTLRMRDQVFPATWDAQQQEGVVAGVVDEAVSGARVVKGFGQEDRETSRLAGAAERLFRSKMRAVRLQARYQPVLQSLPSFGQAAIVALGGWLALRHRISPRYLLGIFHLSAGNGVTGPNAFRIADRRPTGPRRCRAHSRPARLGAHRWGKAWRRGAPAHPRGGELRSGHVRLSALGAGNRRFRSAPGTRRNRGPGRRLGLGQVHGGPVAAPLL